MRKPPLTTILTAVVLAGGCYVGYQLARSGLAAEVYRDRLVQQQRELESLRQRYNQAVSKTAVTELLVEDGRLSVIVRTIEGETRRIETPLDPSDEVYVDYVVIGSRLWIRRVFDDRTPPRSGVVIDPALAAVDWDAGGATVGKAAYRRLGEGRWVVTVTGDGSLGLARAPDDAPSELTPAPALGTFEPVPETADRAMDRIGPGDVLGYLLGRSNASAMP